MTDAQLLFVVLCSIAATLSASSILSLLWWRWLINRQEHADKILFERIKIHKRQ